MFDASLAAQELLNRRVANASAPCLDGAMLPTSIDDALAVHAEMAKLHTVKGWKCLLPPSSEKIIAAPIFDVQQGDTVKLFADKGKARIEPEIGFTLKHDLPARAEAYTEAEIIEAIGSAHMILELMQQRFSAAAAPSFYEKLADCMVNQGLFIGPEIDLAAALETKQLLIHVNQADSSQVFDGKHPNDRAVAGLIWLVQFMNARGVSFKAGETIITGSFCGIVEVELEQPTTISYDQVGQYTLTFEASA